MNIAIDNDYTKSLITGKINIVGLDTNIGLSYVDNDEELYIELLNIFLIDYKDACLQIKSEIFQNKFKSIEVLIHNLKGLLGALGAIYLFEKLNLLEKELLNNDFHFKTFNIFEIFFENFIFELEENLKILIKDKKENTVDNGDNILWLEDFKIALIENNFNAINKWNENKTSLSLFFKNKFIIEITELLSKFEYENILEILKKEEIYEKN